MHKGPEEARAEAEQTEEVEIGVVRAIDEEEEEGGEEEGGEEGEEEGEEEEKGTAE